MDIRVISNRIEMLTKAQEEAKVERTLRAEEIRNSETYRMLTDKINQLLAERKAVVHKNLLVAKYDAHIKELNEEISALKDILNYELVIFHKETDRTVVEDISGHMYKIKFTANIKRTNQPELDLGEDYAE